LVMYADEAPSSSVRGVRTSAGWISVFSRLQGSCRRMAQSRREVQEGRELRLDLFASSSGPAFRRTRAGDSSTAAVRHGL